MNVKELLDKINTMIARGEINLDTNVIYCGEYSYGSDVNGVYFDDMAHVNGEDIISEPQRTLCFSVDSYVFEHEDVGYSDMYIDKQDFNDFKENFN